MPADLFYINSEEKSAFRLGFSRLDKTQIEKGIKIIGETIEEMEQNT